MRNGAHGFTAMELLVTLAISALLLSAAAPSLREHQQNQQIRAAVTQFQSALLQARNEAVHGSVPVVMCAGNPGTGCAVPADWSQGWWTFADASGDRQWQPGERLLRTDGPQPRLVIRSSAGRSSLRFVPNGSAPGSNATISFCDQRGARSGRELRLANSGRVMRLGPGGDAGRHCAE